MEGGTIRQVADNVHQFLLMFLISRQSQRRNGILVDLVDMLPHPEEILHGQDTVLRDELQERHELTITSHVQFGHDGDALLAFTAQLRLHLEGTDAVHLVAEEVDAVRVFAGEREHIDDAAPESVLPRLIHIVHALEAQVRQDVHNGVHLGMLAHGYLQRAGGQFAVRHHLLGDGIGIGHDGQRVALLQAAQHLGAEDFVGGILLSVLDGTSV